MADLLDNAREVRDRYHTFFSYWNITNYVLGLASISASGVAAFLPRTNHATMASILAGVGALLTSIMTFLKPAESASKYLKASDIINSAIRTQLSRKPVDHEALNNAIDRADETVR